jgi:hypothetical protein
LPKKGGKSNFRITQGYAVGNIHGKWPWVKRPWVYAIFLVVTFDFDPMVVWLSRAYNSKEVYDFVRLRKISSQLTLFFFHRAITFSYPNLH